MPEISPLPIAQLTTLRTGGTPARMIRVEDADELVRVLREVWASGDDWLLIGGGSNLLAGNTPFDGTVVVNRAAGLEWIDTGEPGRVRLKIASGEDWDGVVAAAVERGLSGIEAMSGIPGTAGATPIQNVGAYGQEIVDTLVEVELLDQATGELTTVPASELGLGPRTSVLKRHVGLEPERSAIVVSLTLDLERVGTEPMEVRSARIRQALGVQVSDRLSLAEIRARVLAIRSSKGMVIDDADPDSHSAGSFFQNPIVPPHVARSLPPDCPRWPMEEAETSPTVVPVGQYFGAPPLETSEPDVKVSAAWLIEHSGITKGFHLPRSRAAVSSKHALALTNRGGATGEEVAELARFIQLRVLSEVGLELAPEPVLFRVEI